MQRLSTTNAVMPKGRTINSCTVDYQTVYMLIMETQISKLTLSHTPAGNTQRRSQSHNKSIIIRLLYKGDTVKTDSEP
jgi:hypothetical protein